MQTKDVSADTGIETLVRLICLDDPSAEIRIEIYGEHWRVWNRNTWTSGTGPSLFIALVSLRSAMAVKRAESSENEDIADVMERAECTGEL